MRRKGNRKILPCFLIAFSSFHIYINNKIIILLLFISQPMLIFSQGEWDNWHFGWHAAMKFISGSPQGITGSALTQTAGGTTTTVSDSSGNLLFYANGWNIWNRNNVVMPNGSGIIGGNGCQQPVFSTPVPGFHNRYYIFTVGDVFNNYNTLIGLHYSMLDMSLQGGLGDVLISQKNIYVPYGDSAVDQLTGTRSQNNKDIWILVRKHNPITCYLAYYVDASGVHTNPVISQSAVPARFRFQGGHLSIMRGGDMKISYDGKYLVCNDSLTEVCRFNDTSGVVTPLFHVFVDYNITGIEYSIDSKYLYLSMMGAQGNPSNYRLYQFDLSYHDSLSFIQHKQLIGYASNGKLQMGPDWKIYGGANPSIDSINCINNPSLPGIQCNYQRGVVSLLGNENAQDIVQFLQRYKAFINYDGNCQYQNTQFTGDIWPPPDSTYWDFGDPASGPANNSTLNNPTHQYQTIGTFTVKFFTRHIDKRVDSANIQLTILPSPNPDLGIDRALCIGDSAILDAGFWWPGCTYEWDNLLTSQMNIGNSNTYTAKTNGNYRVTVTSPNGCLGIDTVMVNFNTPPDVTNNPLSKSICSGESTNISLTSSVPGTNFHWTATLTSGTISGFSSDSGTVINQVLINTMPTPGIVTYHITPKIGSCAGNTIDFPVTVSPGDSVNVTIAASGDSVCAGIPVIFTAHPTNPGANPVYQWQVNGMNQGTNSTVFTYIPVNGDLVRCILTSSLTVCVSNNPASSIQHPVSVRPNLPVSITLTSTPAPICAGQQVTFTTHPINGGVTPYFQWKVNGTNVGTSSPNYSYIPTNGDLVSCTLTSSELCTTNNPASSIQYPVSVSPILPVSVTISPSQNPFCLGSSVTFTAAPTNGGVPIYQWKVNWVNAGTNSSTFTYTPAGGDVVTCIMNSSLPCTTSNPSTSNSITMIVNTGLPAGVTITATPNPFCPGGSVTCNAMPTNGGPLPSYQWKVNGVNVGINSNTYTYNPANGDSVRCIMTSNLACVTGSPCSSAKIIMSGTLAPVVTFTACFDTITTINAKPIKLKGGIPLGGTYSGPGVNSITGYFNPALAGVGTKTISYSYTNNALCTATKSISIINYPLSIVNCGSNLTDPRDNRVYQTVQIGTQCWMSTNLNFGTIMASSQDQRDNCIAEKYCYNDSPVNCTNHGGLYQWDELMLFDATPSAQGFCPPGWHIPSENDWNILFTNYISNAFAGSPLKYSGFSGFNALLSGARHMNKGWDMFGFATFFWSSTSRSDTKAWAHGLNEVDPSVSLYPALRANAYSVRCLKD
jgi:uncharacterized protein (TIGR02145 family)